MNLFGLRKPTVESMQKKGDVDGLKKLLADEKTDLNVRLEAIQALVTLKARSSNELLEILTRHEKSPKELALAAMKALEMMRYENYPSVLIRWIPKDTPWKCEYATSVIMKNLRLYIPMLVEEIGQRKMIISAARLLEEIGTPEALAGLESVRPIVEEEQRKRAESDAKFRSIITSVLEERMAELSGCKAYQNGHCVVRGVDSGPCTWKPADWVNCGVVIENKKVHGSW